MNWCCKILNFSVYSMFNVVYSLSFGSFFNTSRNLIKSCRYTSVAFKNRFLFPFEVDLQLIFVFIGAILKCAWSNVMNFIISIYNHVYILSSPAMRALNSTSKSCVHHIYALCLKSHELGARCGLYHSKRTSIYCIVLFCVSFSPFTIRNLCWLREHSLQGPQTHLHQNKINRQSILDFASSHSHFSCSFSMKIMVHAFCIIFCLRK